MRDVDTLFKDVTILDGTGELRRPGSVAIDRDRIVEVGDCSEIKAAQVVDGERLALAPGFIDAHCHDDFALLDTPLLEPKVSQGVTTVINGNCGVSVAPLQPGGPPAPAPLNLVTRSEDHMFASFGDYFAALEERPAAVNSACLVGHSTLRYAVMDEMDRPATPEETMKMADLLDMALEDGAIGLSTGLYYPAAEAAPTEEVIEISRTLSARDGLYVTHMRNESDGVGDSLEETFQIGREAGVPVIVSHHKCVGKANHGRSRATLALIDAAMENQAVGLDAYPYTASSTVLQPERVSQCSRVIITHSEKMPAAAGRDLDEIAAEMGCSALEASEQLVPGGAVYFQMDEEDVSRILAYAHTMIGSDGIVFDAHPHPRAWGTFPRVLGHYARERGIFSLEEAVRKMTSLPAERFRLADRGVIKVGAFADLVLFNPDIIIDEATFQDPKRPATGIEQVWTNGACVWRNGRPTGHRPGTVIKRQDLN